MIIPRKSRKKAVILGTVIVGVAAAVTVAVWRSANSLTPSEKAQLLTETAAESRRQIIDNLTDEGKAALEAGLPLPDEEREKLTASLSFGMLEIEWVEIWYKKQAGSATAEDLAREKKIARHFLAEAEKIFPIQERITMQKDSIARSKRFLLETIPKMESYMTGDNARPLFKAVRKAAEEEIAAGEKQLAYLLETKNPYTREYDTLLKEENRKIEKLAHLLDKVDAADEIDYGLKLLSELEKEEQADSNRAKQPVYAEGRRLLEERIDAAKQLLASLEAVPEEFRYTLNSETKRLREAEDAYFNWSVSGRWRFNPTASDLPAPDMPEAAPPKSPPFPSASLAQEFAANTGREAPELPPNRTGIADENLLMLLMAREYEREGYENEARGVYERVRNAMSAEELERALRFLEESADRQGDPSK